MTLVCSTSPSSLDFVKKANFVILIKAHVTRKSVNLHKSFSMNDVRAIVGNSLQY